MRGGRSPGRACAPSLRGARAEARRTLLPLPQLPQGDDSFPGDPGALDLGEAVARRLTVHDGAPWGLDRIDGVDDNSYDDGDLTGGGTGVRVYVVDTGIQGSHVDFGGRVVNGHRFRVFTRDRQKALAYISNTLGHGTKHIKDMENVCSSSPLLVPRSGPFRLNVRAALLSWGQ